MQILFLITFLTTSVNCLVEFNSEFKNAKSAIENPRINDIIKKLYGEDDKIGNGRGGRIVLGIPANWGEFPHQTLQFMQEANSNNIFMCGGSFVRYNWVLTVSYFFLLNFHS